MILTTQEIWLKSVGSPIGILSIKRQTRSFGPYSASDATDVNGVVSIVILCEVALPLLHSVMIENLPHTNLPLNKGIGKKLIMNQLYH